MGSRSRTRRFRAELIEGHKSVVALLVPFDPAVAWELDAVMIESAVLGKRPGHRVRGTIAGCAFEGWVGLRWGNRFIIVDAELRKRAKVKAGDVVAVAIAPSSNDLNTGSTVPASDLLPSASIVEKSNAPSKSAAKLNGRSNSAAKSNARSKSAANSSAASSPARSRSSAAPAPSRSRSPHGPRAPRR